jgi:cytochrome c-type biogenesis protein CcmF
MKPGDSAQIGPYTAVVEALAPVNGPNYTAAVARTAIFQGGARIATVEPAARFYPVRKTNRAEAGIATIGLGQLYMSISNPAGGDSVDVRLYWKPLVTLIWIGALIMGFGGALSLSDRRLRFGIASRARRPAGPTPQAAE